MKDSRGTLLRGFVAIGHQMVETGEELAREADALRESGDELQALVLQSQGRGWVMAAGALADYIHRLVDIDGGEH